MKFITRIKSEIWKTYHKLTAHKYGMMTPTSLIGKSAIIHNTHNLYMDENTNINKGAIIMNVRANFIMKKWSGAAVGLTVITGNHMSIPGKFYKMATDIDKDKFDTLNEYDKDVIVEEDVWIAANVTLLSGVTVGRGAVVGAGSVVRSNVPPYAIVAGNPAKVVGYRFTPNLTILHEQELYPENERLPETLLQENYKKYFVSRIKDIQDFLSI